MTIKQYADTAIEQGKLATEQANEFVGNLAGRAAGAVGELRAQAERALPIDSIKSVVEPYLEQARKHMQKYGSTVSDRAEGVVGSVRQSANNDPRIAKALATAETVAATVQERVVKPVADRTGLGNRVSKPTTATNRKPASTRPATKKATAKGKPTAKKTTTRKSTRTASTGTASTGTASTGTASTGTPSTGTPSTGTPSTGTASTRTASTGTASTGTASTGTTPSKSTPKSTGSESAS
jgi:hypothetical protein